MKKRFERLDWVLMFIPAAIVIVLCMVFMVLPERAGSIIEMLRVFLGDTFGFYYMLLGLGILVLTLGIAFSGYGKIRLGNTDKPVYNNFQ